MSLKFSATMGSAMLALIVIGTLGIRPAVAQGLPSAFAAARGDDGIYIDAARWQKLAGQPGAKLIDLRPAEAYAAGHIEGAINIPSTLLVVQQGELRNELLEKSQLEKILAAAGLSYDDTLVLYNDSGSGKQFITFHQSGFDKVHILDGGYQKWKGPTTTVASAPKPSEFRLTRDKADIVSKEYVLSKLGKPGVVILDSRAPEAYEQGYIPGSYNIPLAVSLDGAAVKPVEELLASLKAMGVTKDSEIITTCGSGPAASNQLTVLRDLGYRNIKLYDGSWNEWQLDPNTPKATKKKV
jgi:thiosulfate/3-mercaptopyruvate sulfurtransferase